MKNWLKNLLFVLFSFVFLGVGIFVAQLFIHEKGNPLKDPNFLADSSVDSSKVAASLPVDSTDGWLGDTVQVSEPDPETETKKDLLIKEPKSSGDYEVIIGIFGEKSNADKQVKKLKELGYNRAYYFSKSSMYVVSAGQFMKTDAEKIALNLKNKAYEVIVKHK